MGPTGEAIMNMQTLPNCIGPLVDMSDNNHTADQATAKTTGRIKAVFTKATEGATFQDPTFKSNYDKAKALSLLTGAYRFGTARPAADQVDNFIKTVRPHRGWPLQANRAGSRCREQRSQRRQHDHHVDRR